MVSQIEGPVYDRQFFEEQESGSLRSAREVIPLLLRDIAVQSVVDVGCGLGTWTSQFIAMGIRDVVALDGNYVDRSMLKIPANLFVAHDLRNPIRLGRRFDLAVCLEVAEHLPVERAPSLVADLVSLAPCVLFSAAIPGQDGHCHVNEQYLSYWIRHFSDHGYEALDIIRPAIAGKASVSWWYQQNITLFAAPSHPLRKSGAPRSIDIVHPVLYERLRAQLATPTIRFIVRSLPGAVIRAFRGRWRLLATRLPGRAIVKINAE